MAARNSRVCTKTAIWTVDRLAPWLAPWLVTSWLTGLACLVATTGLTGEAFGQGRPNHYFHSADMPPGTVGRGQLMRGGPLPGHFQPVEIAAPEGASIALAIDGVFQPTGKSNVVVGMLVGNVYRLKITNIPFRQGQELFPSIEIINRLYPPSGDPARFPIPIQLTREELGLALRGQYVVRVIYLEDPNTALPHREDPDHQRYFDAGADQDPLKVADRLGRPMAILRLGSRIPEVNLVTGRFLFHSPPWIYLPKIVRPTDVPAADDTPRVTVRPAPATIEQTANDQHAKRE